MINEEHVYVLVFILVSAVSVVSKPLFTAYVYLLNDCLEAAELVYCSML